MKTKPTPAEVRAAWNATLIALRNHRNTLYLCDAPAEWHQMSDYIRAVEAVAVWADYTPEIELVALEGAALYAPKQARILSAGRVVSHPTPGTYVVEVPSERGGAAHVVTVNLVAQTALCDHNCPGFASHGRCWHTEAARRIAGLQRLTETPTPQIVPLAEVHNNTDAANDRAEAQESRYARFFKPKEMVTA